VGRAARGVRGAEEVWVPLQVILVRASGYPNGQVFFAVAMPYLRP
jgi:hypothetical protein